MNWPGRRWWVLHRIEHRLLADDLRLGSLFAAFARLTREDAMPAAERMESRPRRLLRSARASRLRRRLRLRLWRARDQAATSSRVSGKS